jgi:hypothetical protein
MPASTVSIFKSERKGFHRPAGDERGRIEKKVNRPKADDRHSVMGKNRLCG